MVVLAKAQKGVRQQHAHPRGRWTPDHVEPGFGFLQRGERPLGLLGQPDAGQHGACVGGHSHVTDLFEQLQRACGALCGIARTAKVAQAVEEMERLQREVSIAFVESSYYEKVQKSYPTVNIYIFTALP